MGGGNRRGVKGGFKRLSFRVTILSLFAALVLVVAGGTTYTQHALTASMAVDASERILTEINRAVIEQTRTLLRPLLNFADVLGSMPGETTLASSTGHPTTPLLLKFLKNNRAVTSAYLGFEDGRFYQAVNLAPGRAPAAEGPVAPPEARFSIRLILPTEDGRRIEHVRFLTANHDMIESGAPVAVKYDPRVRPWYREAMSTESTIVTDFYLFRNGRDVGLTVARAFDGEAVGVLGIDLTLAALSQFLQARQHEAFGSDNAGAIFLFTPNGNLLAHSNTTPVTGESPAKGTSLPSLAAVEDPVIAAVYRNFVRTRRNGDQVEAITVNGTQYAVQYASVPLPNGTDVHLALAMDLEPFLKPMADAQKRTLLISIGIVLTLMPLVYLAATTISRPLTALATAVRDIRHLRFEGRIIEHSRIRELDDLASSVRNMRDAIRGFGKYVPIYVVREIVERGRLPTIGGEVREVGVMFTDIQGFTPWSQSVSPEELLATMSRYLSGMCDVIERHGGIVDKFVGDAIMAYWNAPLPTENFSERACLAALHCRDFADRFAAEIVTPDMNNGTFVTRFGLHVGKATVGNVGSERRMDFTVMGAPINIGSRLEPLNKYYGTQILVSSDLAQQCDEHLLFRWIDMVQPVGALEPLNVFELVGARPDWPEAPPEVAVTPEVLVRCRAWNKIREVHRSRDWQGLQSFAHDFVERFGADPIARIYLERAEQYLVTPPPADWNLATLYLTKR